MARAIQGSLIDQLRRDQVHALDVAAVLESLRRCLADEGIPFALVGALALRHYGYVRRTEGIDILTTREGLDRIHAGLVGRGLSTRAPGLRKSLRETEHQVDISRRKTAYFTRPLDRLAPPLRETFLDLLRESRLERSLE